MKSSELAGTALLFLAAFFANAQTPFNPLILSKDTARQNLGTNRSAIPTDEWLKKLNDKRLNVLPVSASTSLVSSNATVSKKPKIISSSVAERGLNHQVVHTIRAITNQSGQVCFHTNRHVELASGMHYQQNGQWLKSKDQIQLGQENAVASEGPHKVIFPGSVLQAQDLLTPDNKRLRSRVVGLAFFDYQSKQRVFIGELKDSTGQLTGRNRVTYTDAFTGVKAEIRYTYFKSGFEQDVILRERPRLPEEFGLNPNSTRLEVWTEFFDPPEPIRHQRIRKHWIKAKEDQLLDFGAMKIASGTAYSLAGGHDKQRGILIEKQWLNIDGRTFLVEDASFRWMTPHLRKLPARAQANIQKGSPDGVLYAVSTNYLLPKIAAMVSTNQIQIASSVPEEPGLVLDYAIVQSTDNFTFQGDTTYYVSGIVNLGGTTTIEGGTVIKYDEGAELNILGTIDCKTAQYHPAILTARDDDSCGEFLDESTGIVEGHYAEVALSLQNGGDLSNLRILYAKEAIHSFQWYSVKHSQFLHCGWGLTTENAGVTAQNILMWDVGTNFFGRFYHANVAHLTSHQAVRLNDDWAFEFYEDPDQCIGSSYSSYIDMINSLLVEVSAQGIVPLHRTHVESDSSGANVFQTSGAGSHYLKDNSPYHSAGNTMIGLPLLADLKTRTTHPPINFPQFMEISGELALFPQIPRDVGNYLDLGYHYDAIDYTVAMMFLNGGTVNVMPGTTVGFRNEATSNPAWPWTTYGLTFFGIDLLKGSTFISHGTASRPNSFCDVQLVQEAAPGPVEVMFFPDVLLPFPQDTRDLPPPVLDFRFSNFYVSGNWDHLYAGEDFTWGSAVNLSYRDCKLSDGWFFLGVGDGSYVDGNLTWFNTLFDRVSFYLRPNAVHTDPEVYLDVSIEARNNLFRGGWWWMIPFRDDCWTFKDNLFDTSEVLLDTSLYHIDHDYNAYDPFSAMTRLFPYGSHDQLLTSTPAYQTGPLGRFYLPTSFTHAQCRQS
jgi:hypothetical protein